MRPFIIASGLLVTSSVAAAQFPARDTTPVPRALATALIAMGPWGGGGPYGAQPSLFVGSVPDSIVLPMIPRGARVLGGMRYGRGRGPETSHTTVLEVDETPDSILNVIEPMIERAGWRPPPQQPISETARGGFVATRSVALGPFGASGTGAAFCSDDGYLTLSASPAGDVSIVRITVSPAMMGLCDEGRQRMMQRMATFQLPTLVPPSGATIVGGGGTSSSPGEQETRVHLNSRLSASGIVDHFVQQLQEQGWKIASRVKQDDVSVVTASKTEDGSTMRLLLVDNRFDARSHFASLRVWDPSARW